MAGRRRKTRTHRIADDNAAKPTPRSFVVRAGDVGKSVGRLVLDTRSVMQPNTAVKLRERASNKLRDFAAMAGPLKVTHLVAFSKPSETSISLRLGRMPRGPTVSFSVESFMLSADVAAIVKRPKSLSGAILTTPPLLVLNNFPKERNEYALLATVLQNMFPAIKIAETNAATARRVVLFSYNPATDMLDFRHYSVDIKLAGVTKGIKKLVNAKELPDLYSFDDISEFVRKESAVSESDVEDIVNESTVAIEETTHRGKKTRVERKAIRLTELGPRMDLTLVKVQDGFCSGQVLYHKFVTKDVKLESMAL